MKPRLLSAARLSFPLASAIAALLAAPSAHATSYYWDVDGTTAGTVGTTATWATSGTSWSTSSAGTLATVAYTTLAADDLFFSAGTNDTGAYTINLTDTQLAKSLTFEEGTATISGVGGVISLAGGGGITVATGAGNPIISSGLTLNGNNTFNVGAGRTLTLNTGTFTRGTRAALNILNTGTVTSTMTNLSANTNRILGPWASFDTGANTTYAAFNGTTLGGLTYATSPSASQGTSVTATTGVISTASPGTVNYSLSVSAGGSLGPSASINTLRYTGIAGTLATDTAFTTLGIMNAGSGLLTFSGAVTAGASATEMVVNTANADITFSGIFTGAINKTGSGTMTLGVGAAHSIGAWSVNQGTLILNTATASGLPGGTVNSGGTAKMGAGSKISDTGNITVNAGGTFDVAGFGDTIGAINGAGSFTNSTGTASSMQFNPNGGSGSFSGVVSGPINFILNGSGSQTLTGLNTYTGQTQVRQGTLSINSIGDVTGGGTPSAIGAPITTANGLILIGQSAATGTLTYTGGVQSTNRTVQIGANSGTPASTDTGGATITNNGSGALTFSATTFNTANTGVIASTTRVLNLSGSNGGTISGIIQNNTVGASGTGNVALTKSGAGTWILAGGNSYSGGTTVAQGTLQVNSGGTLGANTGTLTLGGGSTTVGNLTLNTSVTTGAITASSDSASNNVITIGTGLTLTTNGNVTVGADTAADITTNLQVTGSPSGSGTWNVTNSGGTFGVGVATGGTNTNPSTLDMSGLGTFSANMGSTGIFRIGDNSTSTGSASYSVTLAANSTITANILGIGDQAGPGSTSTLYLGSGTQTINANTINLALNQAGSGKRGSGTLTFNGASGTLKIRAANGTGTAALNMIGSAAVGNTGNGITATFNTAGRSADLLFSTVDMVNDTTTGTGGRTATFTFDSGTLTATTFKIGTRNSGAGAHNSTATAFIGETAIGTSANLTNTATLGTVTMATNADTNTTTGALNIGGTATTVGITSLTVANNNATATGGTATGTVTIDGGATTLTNGITLAAQTTSGATVNGTLTLKGGTLKLGTAGITTSVAGTGATSTINLQGATLDMNGRAIGGAGQLITNLTFTSGTLQNVLEINGGAVGFTKTGTGTLILSGTNSFTGGVTINAGTVQLGSAGALFTTAGSENAVTFGSASTGTLALAGNSVVVGNLSTNATPGTTFVQNANGSAVSNATLTVGNANNASGTYAGTLRNGTGGGTLALTKAGTGTLTLSGANAFTGGVTINAGTLTLDNAGALNSTAGSENAVAFGASSTGTLTLGGNSVVIRSLNSNATPGAPIVENANVGNAILTIGNSLNLASSFAGVIQDGTGGGTLGLTKAGTNSLTLSGTNTYSGETTIGAGTLVVNGAITNSTINLNSGTLTGSGTVNTVNVGAGTGGIISNNNGVSGGALSIGTLTLAGGANINLFSNTTAADLAVTTLTNNSAANAVTITANNLGGWTNGSTYNLISYTTLNGTGGYNFNKTVNNLTPRQSPTWTDTGSAITLGIAGDNPYWVGDGDMQWNPASTNNWRLVTAGTYTTFLASDDVLFNDNATGAGPILVNIDTANVAPNSTTFSNLTKDYVLSGTGIFGISAGTLTVNGGGNVTISSVNTYSGATNINAGTLTLSGSGTLGTGSALTLGGGKLDLGTLSRTVGAVSVTAPAGSGDTILNGSLTGTSYAASNTTGNAIISANLLVNGGTGFAKTGAGTVTLSGTNTYTGATTISNGILRATTSASSLGAGALSLGGGTLELANDTGLNFGRNTTVTTTSTVTADRLTSDTTSTTHTLGTLSIGAQTLNITRGSLITGSGVAGITFLATTLSAGPAVFDTGVNTNLTLGAVGGAFALTKQGLGQMTLAATSTRTTVAGITNLSAGTLRLESANALNTLATAPLNISGGTLSLGVTVGATYGGTATTVSGTSTVEADALATTANVTQTLGTLSIGANQLNITRGTNITGTGTVVFGVTTLTDAAVFNTAANTTLTLGGNGTISGAFSLTKTGSGNLTLGLVNTGATSANTSWTGGLVIEEGNVIGSQNVNTFGANANAITLGHTSGSANTQLTPFNSFTYLQPITVKGGNSGVATLMLGTTTGTPNWGGAITLDTHDLTIAKQGTTGATQVTGGITGTGNLTIDNDSTSTGTIALATGAINPIGTISNIGSATGMTTISAAIGSNVTNVTQNSATSALTLSSASNAYTGTTTISAGILAIASTGALANTAIGATGTSTFAVQAGSGTVNLGNIVTAGAGATLNLGSGTIFSMVDGTAGGTTNLVQEDTFASNALTLNGAILNFELSGATADKLAVTGALATASVSGVNTINLTPLAALTAGTYNLITTANVAGGLNTGGTFAFASGLVSRVATVSGSNYLLTLNNSANVESVTVGAAAASMTWTGQVLGNGATDATWNDTTSSNWAVGTTPVAFGTGNAITFQDINTVASGNVAAPSRTVTIQAGGVTPGSTTFNNSAVDYTVSNVSGIIGIAGSGGLSKTGSGTVTLAGANTYTGTTTIGGGTLAFTVANTLSGGLTFGASVGSATTGTLDLSAASATFGGNLLVQTNTATANTITIGSGKTLTIGGNVTVGANVANAVASLVTSGGGNLVVGTGGTNTFIVGGVSGSALAGSTAVDLSGLASFTLNYGSAGTFRLGDSTSGSNAPAPSALKLATDNTITVGNFRIGDSSGGQATHVLTLGNGDNLINATTTNIGSAGSGIRSGGSMIFDPADTSGTLTLNGFGGTGTRTILNMINTTGNTAVTFNSIVNLAGHTADVNVSTLTMARRTTGAGGATSTLTFDQGLLDVTTLNMADRSGSAAGVTATVNLGDSVAVGVPTVTIGGITMAVSSSAGTAAANLNITGGNVGITSINMANAGAAATATSNINLTGGTTTLAGNITRTGGAGTENATITLNGGTLNMAGFNIGSATAISLIAQSGELRNLGQLNGGGTLTKTTAGTLTLAGTQTYTGGTTVNAGTLRLNYTTDTTKLSDSAVLTFGGGILDLSGGTHTETVFSTTLTAGTASRLTSSVPGSVLQMNAITPGVGSVIDFGADNIATTDNLNTNGILGTWATFFNGTDWAMNSGSATPGGATVPGAGIPDGFIRAYTGYTDVTRLDGTPALQIINDDSTTNVRIVEGTGSTANLTLGAATTTINTLNQSANGGGSAATIDMAGLTLSTTGILVGTGAGGLTIGTGVNNGFLSAATAAGNLALINNTANDLTINSIVADNATSTLSKSGIGSAILTGVNTYTGGTAVSEGRLVLSNANTISGATSVAGTATLQLGNATSMGTSTMTLASGATLQLRNNNATTFTAPIVNPTTAVTYNFDVNNSGSGSGNKLTLGNITFATSTANTINVTGGNGYTLGLGTLSVPSGSGGPWAFTVNATTAAVTIAKFSTGSFGSALALQGGNAITLSNFEMGSNSTNSITVGGSGTVANLGTTTGTNNRGGGSATFTLADGTMNLTTTTSIANTRQGSGINAVTVTAPTFNINGGTLNNTSGGSLTLGGLISTSQNNNANITINGDFAFGTAGSTSLNNLDLGTGTVSLGTTAGTTRQVTVNGATNLTLGGIISNGTTANSLTKAGTGTLALSGANTYTGTTTISAGALVMGDAAADTFTTSGVTVASNATLAGAGDISGTLDITGILAPGATTGSIGTLKAGATTWQGGTGAAATIWQFDLSAASNASDALAITGNFTKGAGSGSTYRFDFMNSAPTTWGNVYTLVTWTGTTDFLLGDFSYTNLGGAYDGMAGTGFTISGNSLTFTAVPEPTSALAGLLVAAGLLRRRRA